MKWSRWIPCDHIKKHCRSVVIIIRHTYISIIDHTLRSYQWSWSWFFFQLSLCIYVFLMGRSLLKIIQKPKKTAHFSIKIFNSRNSNDENMKLSKVSSMINLIYLFSIVWSCVYAFSSSYCYISAFGFILSFVEDIFNCQNSKLMITISQFSCQTKYQAGYRIISVCLTFSLK